MNYLCRQCSAATRTLPPGKPFRCKHRHCSVVVRANGERIYQFDKGKGPKGRTTPIAAGMKWH